MSFQRKLAVWAICLLATFAVAFSQNSFLNYYGLSQFQVSSPGANKFGLYGFDNPSLLNYLHESDAMLVLNDANNKLFSFKEYGAFIAFPHLSFGWVHRSDSNYSVTDYRVSLGFGDRTFGWGIGYGFVGGEKFLAGRSNTWHWGAYYRPHEMLSIAGGQTFSADKTDRETYLEAAIRPFGGAPFTFFTDCAFDREIRDCKYSFGANFEVLDGMHLSGRYFDDKSISLGVDIGFGTGSIGFQSTSNKDGKKLGNSLFLRSGAPDRSIIADMIPVHFVAKLDLSKPIKYQTRGFFDQNSETLFEVFQKIDRAIENKMVTAIAVNLTDVNTGREMMWEIREKLKQAKSKGKKIIVYVDRGNLDLYHFASVADKIFCDPIGTFSFGGYNLGRSYYKRMLDKFGVGFDEIRLFKYKSAAESFARDKMSEGEREQRQALLDDWLKFTKDEICSTNRLTPSQFDEILNNEIFLSADTMLSRKMVDEFHRWADVDEYIRLSEPANTFSFDIDDLETKKMPTDDHWGNNYAKHGIAIIYAIGECDMDAGIKARSLVYNLQAALHSPYIKAIVLRVDSPGGDPLASDYISELMRKCKIENSKPIIVSQGSVAASGGYWLSMYGTKIVSSPITITGSIGVISSWVYDKGLKDTLGITYETVKAGKYADLGASYTLPIIPLGLPVRKLTDDERSQFEKSMMLTYSQFIKKVADGRGKKEDEIEKIAQGRIWSGVAAKENGLVDELGGLAKAIEIAKTEAGIGPNTDVNYIEFPKIPFFDFSYLFSKLAPSIMSTELKAFSEWDYIRGIAKHNGKPLPIIPLDYYEFAPME